VPPKTRRRHRQGDESRVQIMEAALELAAERGYDGTTVALVTKRTGLSTSSVYWHFKNKDDLVAAALEHSYRRWREQTPRRGPEAAQGELDGQLVQHFREVRDGLSAQPEFWRLGLLLGLLRSTDELAARRRFLEVRAETVENLSAWWASLLPADAVSRRPDLPAVLTQLLLAAGDGLFVAAQTDHDWDFAVLTDALGPAFARTAKALSTVPGKRRGVSPQLARRQAAPAEAGSRLRLLRAAADVAAERGYVGATISRVCERAGLPPSSLYWFFDDKDALLAAVVDHSFTEWQKHQAVWEPQDSADGRAATLRQVLRRSFRSFGDAPDFLRIGMMVSLTRQEQEPAARAHYLAIRRDVEADIARWFAGTLAPGATSLPDVLARVVIAVSDGLFLAEQLDDEVQDVDALVDGFVVLLEAVVATHPGRVTGRRSARS
jgi:AcrR family transcriptional regulator